jgi:hypothetical protein
MQHKHTGYRRNGRQVHEWRRWVATNRDSIDDIALAADVVATRQDFEYLQRDAGQSAAFSGRRQINSGGHVRHD